MKSIQLTIDNPVGLHARPATLFVKAAQQHQSTITVTHQGKTGDAKSILALLALGVGQGAQIIVSAEGSDEEAAVAALTSLVDTNFGEK